MFITKLLNIYVNIVVDMTSYSDRSILKFDVAFILYTVKHTVSVCLFVCLSVHNRQLNHTTRRNQTLDECVN